MKYKKFVDKALAYDSRNRFGQTSDVMNLPMDLREFYSQNNPIDVEVSYNDMPMQFIPKEELESIQGFYLLPKNAFCFASINGDPIFLLDGKVYRSLADRYLPELISLSFDSFIDSLC